MVQNLVGLMPNELLVVFISMLPVAELRLALPIAVASFGMPWYKALLLCCIGNLIPVPFVVVYLKPIFNFFKRSKLLRGLVERLEHRTAKKAEKVKKQKEGKLNKKQAFSLVALYTFVAIPLPGTGAWTGAMIAAVMNMRLKYAFPTIFLGVLTAGIIMLVGTKFFGLFF